MRFLFINTLLACLLGCCLAVESPSAPVTRACDKISMGELKVDAIDNAFTAGNPPKFSYSVKNAQDAPWEGLLRIELYDMLADTTQAAFLPLKLSPQGKAEGTYAPTLPYGVYRITIKPADGNDPAQAGVSTSSIVVANSPAKLAKDLPETWPMGAHHYNPSPILHGPMPGFKWYRTFIGWGQLNPAKDVYTWKDLDATIADLKAVGGKLLLCLEGAPAWTSKRAREAGGRQYSEFAPDDWNDARRFAHELLMRYGDSGVLGAIEPWNEPNANLRWRDTPEALVMLHRIWFEETRRFNGKITVVGISVSPGHHIECVEGLTEAGILNACDVVGGHFYEEPGSPNRLNLRNNLPLHIDLLRIPMLREKRYLPIWDTEYGMGWEGVNGGPRPGGRMKTQNEMIKELHARKDYNAENPWLHWAGNSERRMAARHVTGTVAMLSYGVEHRFSFHPNWYAFDRALNLPWVSNGCLGYVLAQVDFSYIMPLGINAVDGPENVGAVAYRIGKPGGKQVVVLWAERLTTRNPHPGGWTAWLDPVKIQLPCKAGIEVTVQDLYLRTSHKVKAVNYPGGDAVTVEAGEEPVFIWDWQYRDQ